MRLFLARTASARAAVGAEAAPVAVVARICRELDGLPLAIELAAARASVLSAEEIEARLADMFRFLAYRRPVADPRHQALGAAIGWSYELLSEQERRGFRALSVFAGGFGLAAAAAVCCGGDEAAALDLVDLLAGKSLVVAEPAAGGTRYRLLETIRQYAAERLAEAGEAGQARRRHAEAFLRLAEQERELPVLLREQDNFRAALDHALAAAAARPGRGWPARWAASGWPADCSQEGRGWLERALAAGPADQRLRADLLRLLGAVLYAAGDLERAQAILAQGSAGRRGGRPVLGTGPDPGPAGGNPGHCKAGSRRSPRGVRGGRGAAGIRRRPGGPGRGVAVGRQAAFLALVTPGCRPEGPRARRRLRAAKRQPPRGAGVQNLAGGYPSGPAHPGRRGGRPRRAAARSGLRRPVGRGSDTPAALAAVRLRWPVRRRPRGLPRGQSIFTGSGAKLDWAQVRIAAGRIELIAGDPAAAEQILREGVRGAPRDGRTRIPRKHRRLARRGALRAGALRRGAAADRGSRGARRGRRLRRPGPVAGNPGQAARPARPVPRRRPAGRGGGGAGPGDVLDAPERAEFLVAQAEVSRLAGALGQAEASLRRALQFYEDRRMVPLAERTRALLASLTRQRAPR